jgi:hypothetical protein
MPQAARRRRAPKGVVDVSKLLKVTSSSQTSGAARAKHDLRTPQQKAAYEAGVRNGSIKVPNATQVAKAPLSASQGPKFVGGGVQPLVVKNVDGLNDSQGACGGYPPDQAIATDLSYVMEDVNTSIGIFNANTGALQFGPYSAASFFAPIKQAGDLFSHPQMNSDVMRDRWVVVMIEYPEDVSTSYIDIAVSTSTAPTQPVPGGQYREFQFSGNTLGGGGHTSFCDYPTLGIDYYGLYVTCVEFQDDGAFLGNTTFALDKPRCTPAVELAMAGSTTMPLPLPTARRLRTASAQRRPRVCRTRSSSSRPTPGMAPVRT